MATMKIVAFLQNQWFKNPDSAKRTFAAYEAKGRREELIKHFLFRGCKSGRMLKAALGQALCDEIIWEETSREVGGESSSYFPPDYEHMRRVVEKHKPDVIIAFGKQAKDAIQVIDVNPVVVLTGPHPAARHPQVFADLSAVASMVMKLKMEAI